MDTYVVRATKAQQMRTFKGSSAEACLGGRLEDRYDTETYRQRGIEKVE